MQQQHSTVILIVSYFDTFLKLAKGIVERPVGQIINVFARFVTRVIDVTDGLCVCFFEASVRTC